MLLFEPKTEFELRLSMPWNSLLDPKSDILVMLCILCILPLDEFDCLWSLTYGSIFLV